MDKRDIAMEEFKMLQSIIARHDDISFKIKGWCITINIGVVTALYNISNYYFSWLFIVLLFCVLCLVIMFFLWIEAIYRVAMDRAIRRSSEVENDLRKGQFKEYPQINKVLGRPNKFMDQIKTLKNVRIIAPYYIIFIIDLSAIFIKYYLL